MMTKSNIFENLEALRDLWSIPSDFNSEPVANFPLTYYEYFLQEIKRLGIKVITYHDIFKDSDDWNYESYYKKEYSDWKKQNNKSKEIFLTIQHDVDNHPYFTKRMVAMEAFYGIRSNIFIFRDRFTQNGNDPSYIIDHNFFRQAQRHGFVIGYHQNALALAGFNLEKAVQRYRDDVNWLRNIYDIKFVVPHGGIGGQVNGKQIFNFDVPMPEEFRDNLRWVFNRYGAKFDNKWSDGGLRKTRDIKRIKKFDIVNQFLYKFNAGERNFCLVHPQRWGFNVDTQQNPLLAREKWYLAICNSQAN
jgi:hypothetical protein